MINDALQLHAAGSALVRKGLAMQEAALAQLAGTSAQGNDETAQLIAAAATRGHRVSGDGYVSEAAAADLIGVAASTIRQWRNEREPIPWRRGSGNRVQYALADLAAYLALMRKQGVETR